MRLAVEVAIIAALAAGSGRADDWTKTFVVAGRPELRIETDDASVTVRTWDQPRIAVRVTTSGWRIGPGEVEVGQSQAGNRVEITVRTSRRRFPFFSVGMHSIEVEVEAPRQMESDIRTGDGNIDVSGLQGETRLRTGDGRIEGDSLGGSLEATTGDGHMRVSGRLDAMNLRSGDGGIDAELLPGSKIATSWRVESGDGSVTVRLPRDFAADLDLHTGDGRISVDLPLATVLGGKSVHALRGPLNGGGAAFYIRTGDGSIHLGRM
jgi:DUF4097 and DUF4098 domain-containing protein YvlB